MLTAAILTLICTATIDTPTNLEIFGHVAAVDYRADHAAWCNTPAYPHPGDPLTGALYLAPDGDFVVGQFHLTAGPWTTAGHAQQLPDGSIMLATQAVGFAQLDPDQTGLLELLWDGSPVQLGDNLDCAVSLTWFAHQRLIGDSNYDGRFDTADLVHVFQAGQYEDGPPLNSTWYSGDWNADRDFSTLDFVAAFQAGHYEQPAAALIPEPGAGLLLLLGLAIYSTASRFAKSVGST